MRSTPEDFRLEGFEIRPSLRQVAGPERVVVIEARSMDVLVLLAERAGEVVSREELLETIWGEVFVTEEVLTHAIWDLRRALGDEPRAPKFIHTVRKRGYRLVGKVSWLAAGVGETDRYLVGEEIGSGARGVVFRAEDRRLGRTVALKFLPAEWSRDRDAKERFLREARATAALDHPNICSLYEIDETEDGRLFLVMALYEGETLRERLKRGPLKPEEAVEIASQMAAGLIRAHEAGIVHRDIKPGNIMLTEHGEVKILDFGIAKLAGSTSLTRTGSSLGTPSYMAPEQAEGEEVDPRADLWSLGVVLYEMLSGRRPFRGDHEQAVLLAILHHEPEPLAGVPNELTAIVARALKKSPEERYASARAFLDALSALLPGLRARQPSPVEEKSPYPGLASFTEDEARFFFGREAEVEAVWAKLQRQPLLAVIGSSGAGKSSFLRAGLVPAAPSGWRCVVCTPGNRPLASLAQALVPELSGDSEALRQLPLFEEPGIALGVMKQWRRKHAEVVLLVDQFEELFTQNPPEVQGSFVELLGQLALDADAHVLLSMRDDFLMRCHDHPALAGVFRDLTPLKVPDRAALRRAMEAPALACGYRFDDGLVEEMLDSVEAERGALPALAFTVEQLWQERDRARKLLTRTAYEQIGGVGGSLARYAETTLETLGREGLPVVREIFRNLLTAQGTRAVCLRSELLSIFGADADGGDGKSERETAERVLDALIGARLLTSYEVSDEEGEEECRQRIEIIHESLLTAWPRLVRWLTLDAEGAQRRDELRQAARMWEQHDRSDDLLWTGTAFRESQLWLELYPGGLTQTEEAFVKAMVTHHERWVRRRRLAVAAVVAALALGLVIVGRFWRQSVNETRRAEASSLLSLGQVELDGYPSAALAYALASLEYADTQQARRLALKALSMGPTALVARQEPTWSVGFTADGRWLVQATHPAWTQLQMRVIGADGSSAQLEDFHEASARIEISPDREGDYFATRPRGSSDIALWSAAESSKLAEFRQQSRESRTLEVRVVSSQRRIVALTLEKGVMSVDALGFDGAVERLGTFDLGTASPRPGRRADIDRSGRWLGVSTGHDVFAIEIGSHELSEPRLLGRQEEVVTGLAVAPSGRVLATGDTRGRIRLWDFRAVTSPRSVPGRSGSLYRLEFRDDDGTRLEALWIVDGRNESWIWSIDGTEARLLRTFDLGPAEGATDRFWDPAGRWIAKVGPDITVRLWSMDAPADTEPLLLRRGQVQQMDYPSFHPQGRWLATSDLVGVAIWPLARPYPAVIRRHREDVNGLVFGPQGRWLASSSIDGTVRLWPLAGEAPPPGRIVLDLGVAMQMTGLVESPNGEQLLAGSDSSAWLLSLGGEAPRQLPGFRGGAWAGSFSPDGSRVAAVGGRFDPDERVIRVWNVISGEEVESLELDEDVLVEGRPRFDADGRLLYATVSGLHRWDLETGKRELLCEGIFPWFAASADGSRVLLVEVKEGARVSGRAVFLDLASGAATLLASHGSRVTSVALDRAGTIAVTGDNDGVVRVGPVTDAEPHLLLGHEHSVWTLAVDPLGRWIASGGSDGTVRLWPMPDVDQVPLHTLPHDSLIAELQSLTNLRVVPDEASETAWRLTVGPFPGWQEAPTW